MTDERRQQTTSARIRRARACASSAPRRPPRRSSAATSRSVAATTSRATATGPPRPPPTARARCCASRSARRRTRATSSARRSRRPTRSPSPSTSRTGPSRPPARSRRSSPTVPADDRDDDLDDWTSFATSTPRWRDEGAPSDDHEGFDDMQSWGDEDDAPLGALDSRERPTHDDYFTFADLDEPGGASSGARSVFEDEPEERFGEAWADDALRRAGASARPHAPARRAARHRRPTRPTGGDRDMGLAIAVGVALLGLALILFNIGPRAAMVLVTVVIAVAAAELFGVLRQVGYEPVTLAGIVGTRRPRARRLQQRPVRHPHRAVPHHRGVPALVPRRRRRRVTGDEHRRHAARRAVGRDVRLVRRARCSSLGDPGIGILLAAILGTVAYDVGGSVRRPQRRLASRCRPPARTRRGKG